MVHTTENTGATTMQQTTYPTEYRGNTIYDETKVTNLQPEHKPELSLVTDGCEIDRILERNGIEHDRESIILEDSYNCLWVGDREIWGIHKSIPYCSLTAVRLK